MYKIYKCTGENSQMPTTPYGATVKCLLSKDKPNPGQIAKVRLATQQEKLEQVRRVSSSVKIFEGLSENSAKASLQSCVSQT